MSLGFPKTGETLAPDNQMNQGTSLLFSKTNKVLEGSDEGERKWTFRIGLFIKSNSKVFLGT